MRCGAATTGARPVGYSGPCAAGWVLTRAVAVTVWPGSAGTAGTVITIVDAGAIDRPATSSAATAWTGENTRIRGACNPRTAYTASMATASRNPDDRTQTSTARTSYSKLPVSGWARVTRTWSRLGHW